ncbi:MAG: hypothetical protein CMM61_17670 [Rhodospirillaceae bacterium]|nr:hypothetical protein [Rhodospirillaceae bacterium]
MTGALTTVQELFQSRLLAGDETIRVHLTAGGPHLDVYDHAYLARLREVMGEDFPALHTLLGDEEFDAAVTGYLAQHPSSERSVRWLGRAFADWLRGTSPWADLPVAGDMAAFEWGLGLAFDAPDADAIIPDVLAATSPEAWPLLVFDFHPALNTFVLTHDVADFQQAVTREDDPDRAPEAILNGPETWAAWRDADSLRVQFRPLSEDEASGLRLAREAKTFEEICEALAGRDGLDQGDAAMRAAGMLQGWILAGWVAGISAEGMTLA